MHINVKKTDHKQAKSVEDIKYLQMETNSREVIIKLHKFLSSIYPNLETISSLFQTLSLIRPIKLT